MQKLIHFLLFLPFFGLGAQPDSDQRPAIERTITELFLNVDQHDWDKTISLFTDSVYTDYSDLGAKAGWTSATDLVDNWAAFLPNFERTVHHPHQIISWVAGPRATATFSAIATHYLPHPTGNEWTVYADYDAELIYQEDRWQIARISLNLIEQSGNLALPGIALQSSQANNLTAELNEASHEVIERFFLALENNDLSQLTEVLSMDIVQSMPLAPVNFPRQFTGIDQMKQQYAHIINFDQTYARSYFPTSNPRIVIVKYRGSVATNGQSNYRNHYLGLFTLNDNSQISEIIEYFNPAILLNDFPGLQPATYSVHASGTTRDGGVTQQDVSFTSGGNQLRGHLFLPPGFTPTETYTPVLVTGSWTSVKEQMPDVYASQLAQRGFVALTFDFTGFGESEGLPRQLEDPWLKIDDLGAAVDYLTTLPYLDQEELTGMGFCASSGYMAKAVARDDRFARLVLVAPWLHNPTMARGLYDYRPGGTEGLLAASRSAAKHYRETGEMRYVLAASELDPLSAMYVPNDAFDYYLNPTKAAGARYDNRFAVSSWEPWLTFDGISAAEDIHQPTFILHSEQGALPDGTRQFYGQLTGPKEIVWLNDYNQQQLYHEPIAVAAAVEKVTQYLKDHAN